MIREGIVKGKRNGMLEVCFERPEACEKCGACSGSAHTHMTLIKGTAQVGDRVAVDMPDSKVLKVSLLVYAVPLACLVLGLILGSVFFMTDLGCALSGVTLMLLSYGVLHFIDRALGKKQALQPQLVAVVPAERKNGNEEKTE